jgi:inosine-uridine nucleoside N-ribohydrolase
MTIQPTTRIPLILDTDIGTDIDDTWALAMVLRCAELDLQLVVSATGNTEYRAAIVAKLLEAAGRTDVPVGVGVKRSDETGPQAPWVEGYGLDAYPGTLHHDGVGAMIAVIEESARPVTLVCIGPLTNLAEALRRAPHIAARTRFVGMQGSIRRGVDGAEGAVAEYNVAQDVAAFRAVLAAPWRGMALAPLDTCGRIRLRGARYAAIAESPDSLLRAVIENYRVWRGGAPADESSVLFDTLAVHLAYSTEFLEMRRMRLRVTDDGFTVEDREGAAANVAEADVAMEWKDLAAFEEDLVRRLTVGGRGLAA